MPRQHQEETIIFEDLRGVDDDASLTVEVDLDATGDDLGITRKAVKPSGEKARTGVDDSPIDYGDLEDGRPKKKVGGDGDDDDPDDDRFSQKFQKRLDRERRAKRRERERAETAEADNARLRKQVAKSKKTDTGDKDRDLDRQILSVTAELEKAIEDGNTKEHVRLSGDLTDLKAEKVAAKYVVVDDDDDDDLDDRQPRSATATRRSEGDDNTDDWKDQHRDWYGRRGFERQTRLANRLDKEIHAEGYSPEDEDYFEELDRRLKEKAPEVFEDNPTPGNRRQPRTDKGGSPVAAADDASRDNKPRNDSNRVELGEAEFANMRRFGLDPSNPAHIKEYALNKRQSDAEADANAR